MKRFLACAAGAVLLSGCAAGPDFKRPEAPAVDRYTRESLPATTAAAPGADGARQRFVPGGDLPADWWTIFRSAALTRLVERALKSNPNVQAAQAAVRQANELAYAQQGFYFPAVQAGYTRSRQRESGTLSPTLNSADAIFNLHTAQVTVTYAPDVFGLNRRQVEALLAQADAQRFLLEATYLSLTANVVVAAVAEASLRTQIGATEENIRAAGRALDILRKRLAAGAVAGVEVATQEAAFAQAQQALPPLRKQLEQTRNLLAIMTGRLPSEPFDETFELADLTLPEDLPLSVPSKLVDQRPDVRAAEAQVHAASAEIGVAVANMLPQFTITGAWGGTATTFGQMFAAGNPFWSVAGGVTQTLFAGGTLVHRKRAAEAAFEQAAAQYRGTVLAAFQNVADTLAALQADAESLAAAREAERAAKLSLDLVEKQLRFGLVNYLALVNAQQTYQQAVINLAQARANRFSDTAALFQALGGGWWNKPEEK